MSPQIDPADAPRRSAIRCVDEVLEKLDASLKHPTEPDLLGGFDRYALRELAGHLRRLELDSTANRLLAYYRNHVTGLINWFLSDHAVGLAPEAVESLRSNFGEFPLPDPDPLAQAEVQEFRRMGVLQTLRNLAERLRSLRVELVELGRHSRMDGRVFFVLYLDNPNNIHFFPNSDYPSNLDQLTRVPIMVFPSEIIAKQVLDALATEWGRARFTIESSEGYGRPKLAMIYDMTTNIAAGRLGETFKAMAMKALQLSRIAEPVPAAPSSSLDSQSVEQSSTFASPPSADAPQPDWHGCTERAEKKIPPVGATLEATLADVGEWGDPSEPNLGTAQPAARSTLSPDALAVAKVADKSKPEGFRINSSQRTVTWNGKEVPINKQAELLTFQCLHAAHPAVVSYTELLRAVKPEQFADSVAGGAYTEAPPEIKAAVSRIRRALKMIGCKWSIAVIRNTGYQLVPPPKEL